MRNTYLLRDGRQDGPYEETDVRDMLAAGQSSPADLAWQPGIEGWVPLSELLGMPPPPMEQASRSHDQAALAPRRLLPFLVPGAAFMTLGAGAGGWGGFKAQQVASVTSTAGQSAGLKPDALALVTPLDIGGTIILGALCGLGIYLAIMVYFGPTVIAFVRGHHYRWVIAAFNLFFSFTGLGWIIAMVWAVWPSRTSLLDPIAGDPTSNSAAAGRQIYSRWGSYARAYGEAAAPPRLPPTR